MKQHKNSKFCGNWTQQDDSKAKPLRCIQLTISTVYPFVKSRTMKWTTNFLWHKKSERAILVPRWCGRPDLNRYGCPHAPQTCASAYSATTALKITILLYNLIEILSISNSVFIKFIDTDWKIMIVNPNFINIFDYSLISWNYFLYKKAPKKGGSNFRSFD